MAIRSQKAAISVQEKILLRNLPGPHSFCQNN
uniref:Uncharacterized protein n=1 Tax=Macrostomum lignano TaxID=282301 RepID=A0A1I8J0E2_9PLAT